MYYVRRLTEIYFTLNISFVLYVKSSTEAHSLKPTLLFLRICQIVLLPYFYGLMVCLQLHK
jgi:hypothetical protein